ncbi:MAG: hypothetical protein WKF72_09715 [Nocardioidaceae bacterium]
MVLKSSQALSQRRGAAEQLDQLSDAPELIRERRRRENLPGGDLLDARCAVFVEQCRDNLTLLVVEGGEELGVVMFERARPSSRVWIGASKAA